MIAASEATRGRPGPLEPTPRVPHRAVLAPALVVGVAANLLVRTPQGPGLNMSLFFVTLALAIGAACRMTGHRPSREAWGCLAGGTLVASGLVLRASPVLQTLAFVAASAAFALPALRAGSAWLSRSGVSDHLEAVAGAVLHAGLGGFRVAADALSSEGPGPGGAADAGPEKAEDAGPRRWPSVLRGVLLAAPLLLVFGGLFASADRVFAGLVTDLVGTTIDEWASHVVVTALLAWLAAGYLTGFLTGTRVRGLVEGRIPRPSVGGVEIGVALGLVDLLFAAFVAVQFRYLFGGAGLVEVTPGLTYAEYTREGFGQLALASALVLPTLLLADWLLRRPSGRDRTVFRAVGGVQLLLLVLVIGSAFQRVRAYQEAYGLTESRFYGVVFLGWLTLLGVGFGLTVLRGRRERFAFPSLLSGFAVVAVLFVANPDAWIARTNLARSGAALAAASEGASEATSRPVPPTTAPGAVPEAAAESSGASAAGRAEERAGEAAGSRPSVDAGYLGSLSADAVPTLLRALPRLRSDARCRLARRLLERWGGAGNLDWRSWNRAVVRAREAVRAEAGELRSMVGPDPGCP